MKISAKIRKFLRLFWGIPAPYPQDIQIEITNRCNLNCAFCPRELLAAPTQDMPWSLFCKVITDLSKPRCITLTGWGEPLLHPGLPKMIKYINQKLPQTEVKFTTNASLLRPLLGKKILKLNLAEIALSLDTLEPKDQNHNLSPKLAQNIRTLSKMRGLKKHPRLCLQTLLLQNSNLKSVIEFADCNQIEKVALLRTCKKFNPSLARPDFTEEREMIQKAKKEARARNLRIICLNQFNPFRYLATRGDQKCLRTDDHIYITVEGQATPCCNLRNYNCGSILRQKIQTIWQGLRFQNFRRIQEEICTSCDALHWKQKK